MTGNEGGEITLAKFTNMVSFQPDFYQKYTIDF